MEVFVWYRCAPERATAVQALAERLLDQVAAACGVRGRLLGRWEDDCTFMEHYVLEGGGARLPVLQACIARHWPAGAPVRHEETFHRPASAAGALRAEPVPLSGVAP